LFLGKEYRAEIKRFQIGVYLCLRLFALYDLPRPADPYVAGTLIYRSQSGRQSAFAWFVNRFAFFGMYFYGKAIGYNDRFIHLKGLIGASQRQSAAADRALSEPQI